jgi:hypothetical protein
MRMLVASVFVLSSLAPGYALGADPWCEGAYDAALGSNFGQCGDVALVAQPAEPAEVVAEPVQAPWARSAAPPAEAPPALKPVTATPPSAAESSVARSEPATAYKGFEPELGSGTESEQQQLGEFRSPVMADRPDDVAPAVLAPDTGAGAGTTTVMPETESEQQQRGEFRSPLDTQAAGAAPVAPVEGAIRAPETESEQQQRGEFRSPLDTGTSDIVPAVARPEVAEPGTAVDGDFVDEREPGPGIISGAGPGTAGTGVGGAGSAGP